MSNRILKWVVAGALYLAVVIGAYSVYDNTYGKENQKTVHQDHGTQTEEHSPSHEENEKDDHQQEGHKEIPSGKESEVFPTISYKKNRMVVSLKDKDQEPVNNLEVNHEKYMHLIVVSSDLKDYYHLHPEQKGSGNFTVNTELAAGTYQVFVDIKPKNYEYHISSLSLQVGQGENGHGHNELIPDQTFTKTINGTSVTLRTDQWTVGKPITLDFQIEDQKPEPYLGALGHVVILDKKAQNFIHVHPVSESDTKFSTTFEQPGVYKIWGEFKLNGKVNVYPFVVEVK